MNLGNWANHLPYGKIKQIENLTKDSFQAETALEQDTKWLVGTLNTLHDMLPFSIGDYPTLFVWWEKGLEEGLLVAGDTAKLQSVALALGLFQYV